MRETLENLIRGAASMMEHASVSVSLSGWPASVAVLGVCGAVVAVSALELRFRLLRI